MRQFRYSRWDDTQDPFGADVPAAELLEELSDDILSGAGAEGALSRLMRRGMQGRFGGLDALRARLRERRRREQGALNLQGPLEEIREQLEGIIERERSTLSFEPGDDARMRETFLDALPPDVPGQVKELTDYRFVDARAQQQFDALMDRLREEGMGASFRNVAQGMRNLSGEELARFRDMLAELDRSLRGDYAGASIDAVDEEALRNTLGEDAVRDLRRPKQIKRMLEEAGLVSRRDGRLDVTPKGARKLGERALVRVFEELRRDREGTHDARDTGGLAEPTGATRPWRFGDAGQIAVQRTVFNAVVRGEPGQAVRLRPEDFELVEAEQRTETATALLLDLSFSMPLRGHFVHAKRMALALHALIEGRYPHDRLYMIGFSDYARRMEPQDLTAAEWERVYGTNMQHAFNLAGRLLSQHPRSTRQGIMVTDGEPTAP